MKKVVWVLVVAVVLMIGLGMSTSASASTTGTSGYVMVKLKPGLVFNESAFNESEFTYAGLGQLNVSLVSNNTVRISLRNMGEFVNLFAPPGYSTSHGAADPSSPTILSDVLSKLRAINTELGTSVSISLNDVELGTSFDVSRVYVTALLQHYFTKQKHTVLFNSSGAVYITGWRNNRGTILIDGADYTNSFGSSTTSPYQIVTLGAGSHNLTLKTPDTSAAGHTEVAISIITLNHNLTSLTGKFNNPNKYLVYKFEMYKKVSFVIKDGLSGEPLSDVTVSIGVNNYTLSNGDTLELMPGTYTVSVSKSGYNSGKATITINGPTTLVIKMYSTTYPSPSEITVANGSATVSSSGSGSGSSSSSSGSSWNWPATSGDMGFIAAFIAMIIIGAVLIPLQRYDEDGTVTKHVLLLIAVAVIAVVAGIMMKWL